MGYQLKGDLSHMYKFLSIQIIDDIHREQRFGSRVHLHPVFSKKISKLKTYQKIPKQIMHVPDHVAHHHVFFRAEMT